jgi:hypothetical protein
MRSAILTRVRVPGQPPRYFPTRREAEPYITHLNRSYLVTGTAEVRPVKIAMNKDGLCALLNRELLRKEQL